MKRAMEPTDPSAKKIKPDPLAYARQQFELYLAMASQWKTQLDAMEDDDPPIRNTPGSASAVPPVKSPTSPADALGQEDRATKGDKQCATSASMINPKEEIDDASPTPPIPPQGQHRLAYHHQEHQLSKQKLKWQIQCQLQCQCQHNPYHLGSSNRHNHHHHPAFQSLHQLHHDQLHHHQQEYTHRHIIVWLQRRLLNMNLHHQLEMD